MRSVNATEYHVCEHCGCHEEGNLVVIHNTETGNHLVCEYCAQTHYILDYEGEWHDMDYVRKSSGYISFKRTDYYYGPRHLYRLGEFMTAQAYSDFGDRFCECCNRVVNRQGLQTVWIEGDEKSFCDNCIDEYIEPDEDYERCHDCGEWMPTNDMVWAECHNAWICDSCYERDYARCYGCEEIHHDSDMHCDDEGDCYCNDCYERGFGYFSGRGDDAEDDYNDDEGNEEGEYMHDYGYDPDKFIFYTSGAEKTWAREQRAQGQSVRFLYFGFELEASHPTYSDRDEHSSIIFDDMNPLGEETWFYQKHDSSLHKGIEMVSHPMTFNYLLEHVRPTIEENLPETAQYIGGGASDGFHIHVSRLGMNKGHRIRFGAFFELCKYQMEICARRRGNSYAQFLSAFAMNDVARPKDLIEKMAAHQWDRRRCVNWLNGKTVEVRMFNSTSRPSDLYAAFALVHAVYQFTKRVSWKKMFYAGQCGVLWDWFLDFAAQDKRYLDLFDQLDRLDDMHNMGSVRGDDGEELDYYFMKRDHDMYEIPCAVIISRSSFRG